MNMDYDLQVSETDDFDCQCTEDCSQCKDFDCAWREEWIDGSNS